MNKTKRYTASFSGDLLEIATITRWLVLNGHNPRSRNEVLNLAVQHLARTVAEQKPEAIVVSISDAEQYLESAGLGSAKRKPTAKTVTTNLRTNLTLPTGVSPDVEAQTATNTRVAMGMPSSDDMAEIMRVHEKVEKRGRNELKGLGTVPSVPDSSPIVTTDKH